MEPRIQYAKTADGVSIAYSAIGEGEPLIWAPTPGIPAIQQQSLAGPLDVDRQLARGRKVVNYDGRGTGLSDRDVRDFSLKALMMDLAAVIDALGAGTAAVFGAWSSAPVAIGVAVRHPERVSHLLLWCPYRRNADFLALPHARALNELAASDWDLYTETMVHTVSGWGEGTDAHRLASMMRESVSQETYLAALEASMAFDATDFLSAVKCPALVLQRRRVAFPSLEVARDLAARIPHARLAVLEGDSGMPWAGDVDAVLRTIDEFLAEDEGEPPQPLPSGMTAILFADIADSTGLTERMGDAPFREKARALDAALRTVIRENGGTAVEGKLLGDGVLAVFTSARQGIEAALACGRAGEEGGLPLHLGLHAGDVIREEDPDGRGNVYGGAVNIAARISALSAPGEVLVSDTLRGLARTSAGGSFEERGERDLKGVSEPVRVWAVRGQDDPSTGSG